MIDGLLLDDEDAYLYATPMYLFAGGYVGLGDKSLLHRLLTNAQTGEIIDHVNGNKLDNRRSNLRRCPRGRTDNGANRGKPKHNTSGYKGVSKRNNNWVAQISVNSKTKYLGVFACPIEAARAYDKAAIQCFGEFARLNFPEKES